MNLRVEALSVGHLHSVSDVDFVDSGHKHAPSSPHLTHIKVCNTFRHVTRVTPATRHFDGQLTGGTVRLILPIGTAITVAN